MKYKVFSDGAARGNPGAAGAGFVVYDDSMTELKRDFFPLGVATNNVAEYTALLKAAEYIKGVNPESVDFYLDSELIVNQLNGKYKVRAEHLVPYYEKIKMLLNTANCRFFHVRREQNKVADMLANLGADESEKTLV